MKRIQSSFAPGPASNSKNGLTLSVKKKKWGLYGGIMGIGSVHHRRENVVGGVYIGRPSVFGNPFVIGVDGDRAEVIDRFREYAIDRCYRDVAFRRAVAELFGRKLVCWCAPAPCHGDVLLDLAAALR
jgi:hypothetical protein